jgi:hypothetical protein
VGLIEKQQLISNIAPPLDYLLATQLVEEFVSLERRYIQRDWEPAELDGGQFCEVLARILYHQDSGNYSPAKEFDKCAEYIENEAGGVSHALERRTALHLVRVLRTVYKFRSQRGAVHISPKYGPNHMDARLMIECVRWAMNETLRVFWHGKDREAVAKAIRELLQFDVPCVGVFEEIVLVQRTDLSTEEELLVLLHYGGDSGLSRAELGRHAKRQAPRITEALQRLEAADCRQIVLLPSGRYRLTDLGARRIRDELADKLLLQ